MCLERVERDPVERDPATAVPVCSGPTWMRLLTVVSVWTIDNARESTVRHTGGILTLQTMNGMFDAESSMRHSEGG